MRRRRDPDTVSPRTIVVGGGGLLAALVALWVAFSAPSGLPGKDYYGVAVQFEDLANLPERGADVRIGGSRVGQALRARLVDGRPTIDLQLDADLAPLRSDTTARVRPRGLLGLQFIDVVPGSDGEPIGDGGTLVVGQTSASVQLPELLGTFDAPRRRALADVIDALGEGMVSRGSQLNQAMHDAPAMLQRFDLLARAVLERDGAPRRFVAAAQALAAATVPVRDVVADGFRPAARALSAFGAERESLSAALEVAPSTLDAARAGLARSDTMLVSARGFAAATTRLTAHAPRALRETTRLLLAARGPLGDVRPVLRQTAATVPAVLRVTDAADPVLPRLEATLDAAIAPSVELGSRGCDLLGFAANWNSLLRNGVPGGGPIGPLNVVRFEMFGAQESVAGAGAGSSDTGRNPYPAPCVAGAEDLP